MHHVARLLGTALPPAALLALAPACGHRGDPLPPLRQTPPPLQGFRLAQRGEALEVSVVAPAASVDGLVYQDAVVEFLFAQGDRDLEKAGERRTARAPAGQRVVETLPLPPPGTVARAAARGRFGREKGPRTLTLALVAQPPLSPPRELVAGLVAEGVRLVWQGERPEPATAAALPARIPGPPPASATAARPPVPPGASPSPPPPVPPFSARPPGPAEPTTTAPAPAADADQLRKAGFLVYRRTRTDSYAGALVPEPFDERRATDATAPQGVTVCYVVRSVASLEPLVESAPSNEACLEVKDIAAPAAPLGLAVLPREAGLELLWSPSPAGDLAGYRVYRAVEGEAPRRLAEVEATRSAWLDTSAGRGVSYWYTLTAFDRSGNESAPSEAAEGSLP